MSIQEKAKHVIVKTVIVKTTQGPSTGEWICSMVYSHNGIFSNKKKGITDIYSNVDESQNNSVKEARQEYKLCDSIYLKF